MDTAVGARAVERRDISAIEPTASAVSWAAILAGTMVAAATSLILLSLGAGLGFASVSPWSSARPSLTTFTAMMAIWLIVVQWLASAMGGYMAGRLRTRWAHVHVHETFFRDTAHGFLAWAVATVLVAGIATSVTSSAVGTGARAAGTAASGAAQAAGAMAGTADVQGYTVDALFRASQPGEAATPADARDEAMRILAMGGANGDVPATDRSYLAQLVAARTGIPEADAQKRVDDAVAQGKAAAAKAKDAADQARKAGAAVSIFTALSMVVGAFIAAVAAAYGGRLRDEPGW